MLHPVSRRFFLTFCLFFVLWQSTAAAGNVESYRYREVLGEQSRIFSWTLHDGTPLRLVTRGPEEQTESRMAPDGRTLDWTIRKEQEETRIVARREGNTIHLTGQWQGEEIARQHALDSGPWIQAMSFGLGSFIRSGRETLEFWTLRPDTLEPFKLQAAQKGSEVLSLGDREISARKVRVRVAGWKALFWSADYWFDPQGRFLRFQGPGGPPGSPECVVTLIEPSLE